jgi:hypothetical protein
MRNPVTTLKKLNSEFGGAENGLSDFVEIYLGL